MKRHTAYISAGSNMGDKLANCRDGLKALTGSGMTFITAWSNFYKTSPVDFTEQDWFVNAAVKVETGFDPFELLKDIISIQARAGRTPDPVRFGPRVLDLDIIFYDDIVVELQGLTIPHPRMHNRRFVLKPLCDIDPDYFHPVFKRNLKHLLDSLDDNDQKVIEYK